MILDGFQSMAVQLGPEGIEAELLPQCWEQINHKYEERRILVAETCGAIMPFVPQSLRCSLMPSMLQQLALEDSDEDVRLAAIKSITILVTYLGNQ